MLPERVHTHDREWVADKLAQLPRHFRPAACRRYDQKAQQRRGRGAANAALRQTVDGLPPSAWSLAADDEQLRDYAKRKADRVRREAAECGSMLAAHELAEFHVRRAGLEPPEYDPGRGRTLAGAVARMACPAWWRRAVRTTQARQVEQVARELFMVHKSAGIYSSEETVFRRRGQKTRNRRMLEEVQAVNELGEGFTLAELADLSVSNPVIRRGELMTRIAGFEQIADVLGHVGEFVTLTCPSRMHKATINANTKRAAENRRYDGTTPREAQKYLGQVWARIRAALARHKIKLYGFRVAEPHHDGCPHWHFLVFLPAWARRRVRWEFRRHGLRADGHERGASERRVTFKAIDKAKGTAAGYIAKYIAKNIDGHAIETDLYGVDAIDAAERVDAWAACWGIRQFQQVGGPPVTVWRELRRLDEQGPGALEDARAAADSGDWFMFVKTMGGPTAGRDVWPVRPAYWQETRKFVNTETGELFDVVPGNRYGEQPAAALFGVKSGGEYVLTRVHTWELMRKGATKPEPAAWPAPFWQADPEGWELKRRFTEAGPVGHVERGDLGPEISRKIRNAQSGLGRPMPAGPAFAFERGGAAAAPWSPVNNCTRSGQGQDTKQAAGPPKIAAASPPGGG